MNRSEQINELAGALAKAQGTIDDASKDATNPHFKSRYADFASVRDAIRLPLSSNGLSYLQALRTIDKGLEVETMLAHSSGQFVSETLMIPLATMTAQTIGSAATYGKRYALMAMIGIAASEDDDGNAATSAAPLARLPAPRTIRGQEDIRQDNPFNDDFPGDAPMRDEPEPAISTAAINIGRELRACKTMPMLVELWTSERIKAFYKAAHAVDRKSIEGAKDAQKAVLNDADLLAAG